MTEDKPQNPIKSVVMRTFEPEDHLEVACLYSDGLLAGQLPPHDTGSDIEHIQQAYFNEDCNHLWVAQLEPNDVVGMIGVVRSGEHTGEIRRLRVEKQHQGSGIAVLLLETALAHCKRHGYLKVVLDTRFDTNAAIDRFERFGFQHTRTINKHGKELLEFYLDLYRQTKEPEQLENSHDAA